jgi:hypothetical protein
MVCIGTINIDKLDFLDIYPAVRAVTYKVSVIIVSFTDFGIISYLPERVLQKLDICPPIPTLLL